MTVGSGSDDQWELGVIDDRRGSFSFSGWRKLTEESVFTEP